MLQAKKRIQEKINQGLKVNERTTIAQTVAPGSTRKAHVPAVVQVSREEICFNVKDRNNEIRIEFRRQNREIYNVSTLLIFKNFLSFIAGT